MDVADKLLKNKRKHLFDNVIHGIIAVSYTHLVSEMIPVSSLESFTRESIKNRSFSDCLYSASTFAFADAGRVSSIKSCLLYTSRCV